MPMSCWQKYLCFDHFSWGGGGGDIAHDTMWIFSNLKTLGFDENLAVVTNHNLRNSQQLCIELHYGTHYLTI